MSRAEVPWQERWHHRFYGSRPGWIDGTTEFWNLCRDAIRPGSQILEIGAGPSNPTSRMLAGLGELHGADLDPAVNGNESLRTATVFDGRKLPFQNESFSACVSDFVLEHVEDPAAHFAEVRRVLRVGGVYVFRTPNRWHYVSLVARLTPHWFHDLVSNRLRNLPADAHQPYPTFHRANSRGQLRALARGAGLELEVLHTIEKEPSYGMLSRGLFLTFMAYERVVNSSEAFGGLRANVLGAMRRR